LKRQQVAIAVDDQAGQAISFAVNQAACSCTFCIPEQLMAVLECLRYALAQ
jgi:hypothetical protein